MRFQEQIYTSAPRLLEGGGNLGVVAQSRDFPRSLAPALASLRAYTLLPQYDLADPAAHPPRLVCGPSADGAMYVITRTVFAGADHTGRTTPLTHHVAVDMAAAKATCDGVAELLMAVWPMLATAWPDAPRWIEPARELALPVRTPPASSPAWRAVLPWLADVLVHYPHSGRSAVAVIDPNTAADVPAGFAAALALLPASIQWTTTLATHVVGMSDFVREAALLVTYADSSFLGQCAQRRDSRAPLVFDLSTGLPSTPAGAWGDLLRQDSSPEFAHSRLLAKQFDYLELAVEDVGLFIAAARVVNHLNHAPREATSDQWRSLGGQLSVGDEDAAVAGWIGQAATDAVRALAADVNSASRWSTLSAVALDTRWHASARTAAVDAVLGGGDDALTALADEAAAVPGAYRQALPLLRERLAHFPVIRETLMSRAVGPIDQATAYRLAALLPVLTLSTADGRRWVTAVLGAPAAVRGMLEQPLRSALATSIRRPSDIVQLGADQRDAARAFVIPLLRDALANIHDITWHDAATRYRDAAISAGLQSQDYGTLFEQHGRSLRPEELNAWLNDPRLTPEQRRDIEAVAIRTGLHRPTPSYEMRAAAPVALVTSDQQAYPRSPVRTGGGVGPIALGRYVSLLVIVACGISFWVSHHAGRPRAIDHVLLLCAVVPVVLWLVSEVFLRLFIRSPQQFGVARAARWGLLVLLILSFLAAIMPSVSRLWRGHAQAVPVSDHHAKVEVV